MVCYLTREGNPKDVVMDEMPVWGRSAGVLAFIDAIRTGIEPESSGRRNLGSVALMEAAERFMASGQVDDIVIPGV